jgi:hypothetical protein
VKKPAEFDFEILVYIYSLSSAGWSRRYQRSSRPLIRKRILNKKSQDNSSALMLQVLGVITLVSNQLLAWFACELLTRIARTLLTRIAPELLAWIAKSRPNQGKYPLEIAGFRVLRQPGLKKKIGLPESEVS